MGNRIYVGNLPFGATEEEVRSLFAAHGQVSEVKFIYDRDDGRFRGFGFVSMSTDEEAAAAIGALDGFNLGGRKLTVNEAQEKSARPREDGRADRGPKRGGGRGR